MDIQIFKQELPALLAEVCAARAGDSDIAVLEHQLWVSGHRVGYSADDLLQDREGFKLILETPTGELVPDALEKAWYKRAAAWLVTSKLPPEAALKAMWWPGSVSFDTLTATAAQPPSASEEPITSARPKLKVAPGVRRRAVAATTDVDPFDAQVERATTLFLANPTLTVDQLAALMTDQGVPTP